MLVEILGNQGAKLGGREANRAGVDEGLDDLLVDHGKALVSQSVGQILELVLNRGRLLDPRVY